MLSKCLVLFNFKMYFCACVDCGGVHPWNILEVRCSLLPPSWVLRIELRLSVSCGNALTCRTICLSSFFCEVFPPYVSLLK